MPRHVTTAKVTLSVTHLRRLPFTGALYIGSNKFNLSKMMLSNNSAFSGGSIYINANLARDASLYGLSFGAQNTATRGDRSLGCS